MLRSFSGRLGLLALALCLYLSGAQSTPLTSHHTGILPQTATILPTSSSGLTQIPQPRKSAHTRASTPESSDLKARVAIIIDDIGYRETLGRRAINLPGALTISVLPLAPNSRMLAEAAHKQGKEVMLHAPMSNIRGLPLDEGALTEDMDQQQFLATLDRNLQALPHIRGVNNHMGSQLTQTAQPMAWLMAALKQRQLYFIDSRTSPASRAWAVAREHQVPSDQRDVFLDHDRDPAAIARQYQRLLRIAHKRGSAIAIGHPYPETLDFLEVALRNTDNDAIELVPISRLLEAPLQMGAVEER